MLRPGKFAVCLLVAPAIAAGCGSSKTASTNKSASVSAATGASGDTGPQAPIQSTGATGATGTGRTTAQHTAAAPRPSALAFEKEAAEKQAAALKVSRAVAAAKVKAEEERVKREVASELKAEETRQSPGFRKEVPKARQFPPEVYRPYFARCEGAKGAIANCECILVKLELTNGPEKGQLIAELLAVQLALQKGASLTKVMNHGVVLPPNAQRAAGECRNV